MITGLTRKEENITGMKMNKKLTEKLCDYSTLNKEGEEIADAHCVGCKDLNYENCAIYRFQRDFPLTQFKQHIGLLSEPYFKETEETTKLIKEIIKENE